MSVLHALGLEWQGLLTETVGFLILIGLLARYGFGPLFNILDKRQAEIKSTYDQLDADRAAMDETRKEYERRLAAIEEQARERIQEAVREAQELRTSMIADAKKQAEALVETGRGELERERARTFVELRRQIADLAIQAATKVVGQSMDDPRQRALVDEFITAVASPHAAAKPLGSATAAGNGAGTI